MRKQKIRLCICIIMCIGVITFIFYNSFCDLEKSNEKSKVVSDTLQNIVDSDKSIQSENFHVIVRGIAHICQYALLGISLTGCILCLYISHNGKVVKYILSVLLCILFIAVIDEFIQSFFARISSAEDILLDFLGGMIGIIIALFIRNIVERSNSKKRKIQ